MQRMLNSQLFLLEHTVLGCISHQVCVDTEQRCLFPGSLSDTCFQFQTHIKRRQRGQKFDLSFFCVGGSLLLP